MYVAFEGLEAAPTHRVSEEVFAQLNTAARWTEEPSNLWTGQFAQQAQRNREADPLARFYALLADRAQHCRDIVRPALDGDFVLVSNRGPDTIRAYQPVVLDGYVEDPAQFVETNLAKFRDPDVTFWLSVEPRAGSAGDDHVDTTDRLEFQQRINARYDAMTDHYGRFVALDAARDAETIAKDAVAVLEERF